MKVLYLIHYAGQGGTERYVLTLAEKLRKDGRIQPYFAYTRGGYLSRRMEELGVPSYHMAMPSRYSLGAARRVAALCREKKIEVIHTHFLRENYIALLARLFYPAVRVVYTNHLILRNDTVTRISNRIFSRGQSAVIAVCRPGMVQLVKNQIPRRLITVIHNAVEPGEWTRDREMGAAVRKETGVPEDIPVILYAARLVEGKGHGCLLAGLEKAARTHAFHLLLAGDGPLRETLETQARQRGLAGRVTFLGFRQDVRALLSAADIGVNAAGTEACSFNILEAMAAGVPQAVADAGGNGDLIDGKNGLRFAYNDAEALSEAVCRLLSDPVLRKACAEKAQEAVNGPLHIRVMLDKTYAVYQGGTPNE